MDVLALLALLVLLAAQVRSQYRIQKVTDNRLETWLDTLVHDAAATYVQDASHVGLSIGIFKNGEIYTYNYGTLRKGINALPDSTTIYEIGSISKTFTGLLLAQAILDKKIKPEDDIRDYLAGAYPNLEYKARPIRIIDLANHSSGLPSFLPDKPEVFQQNPDSVPFLLASLHRNYTKDRFLKDLHNVKIDTVPGFKYRYSNAAVQLLGFILERAYCTNFAELIARYITTPLGMRQTRFSGPAAAATLSRGYDAKGVEMPYMPELMKASGGIYSSVSDMLRYIHYQLDEQHTAVRLSHTPSHVFGDGAVLGLYWRLDKTPAGKRELWHTGGTFGFSSYCVLYPEENTGLILLSNEFDPGAELALVAIAQKLVKGLDLHTTAAE